MSKTVKAFAKINIALNVLGVNEGYHNLDSVVTTVNKYNLVKVTKRKDNKILVSFVGKYGFIPTLQEETNAYKAAKLFMDTFKTSGVDIEITVNIPTGSGMGGSSVDIVGVLGGMKKLFKIDEDLKPLADSLGSDSGYLLKGGFARIRSRGEVVDYFDSGLKLYFVVIYGKNGVNTKTCFEAFDKFNKSGEVSDIESLIDGLKNGDITSLDNNVKNALYDSATKVNEEVKLNLNAIKALSPRWCGMTGSGSTVFAIYENYEMASWAEDKLKKQKYNAELLTSYDNKTPKILDVLFDRIIN